MIFQQEIQKAAELIKNAKSVVALTGAGISTPSGIPDFRSADSGLWNQVNPMAVASIMGFKQNPADFYNWVRPFADKVFKAEPNSAHIALAQLEEAGLLSAVITQNIDGLHQAANSQTVYEVHGHIREVTCINCFHVQAGTPIMEQFIVDGLIPTCEKCEGTLKPNTILFGEQLPIQVMFEATAAAEQADVMLITGSSLEVAPISELPRESAQRGTRLIIINLQDTYVDSRADVVIHEEVTRILPEIARLAIEE